MTAKVIVTINRCNNGFDFDMNVEVGQDSNEEESELAQYFARIFITGTRQLNGQSEYSELTEEE
ncbi:hypothetical protein ACEV6Q_06925 [Enterobacter ludwigii]|uniref:hypothetical protein n=1 Tax=Enterobacter ludwigii TaxID=299767 RepID=UPI003BEF3CC9